MGHKSIMEGVPRRRGAGLQHGRKRVRTPAALLRSLSDPRKKFEPLYPSI